jgi:hypothetical protein
MFAPTFKKLATSIARNKLQRGLTFKKFIKNEEGSVEAGLVLIPTLILFLSVLQLPTSVLTRVAFSNRLQSDTYLNSFVGNINNPSADASNRSLGSTLSSNSAIATSTEKLAMPGGGDILVKDKTFWVSPITPLLISGDQFKSVGISVDENN